MPIPLADPGPTLYVVLVALLVVAAGVAARWQSRGSLLRLAVAAALLIGLVACDFLAESPREEAVRRVQGMAAAVTARNPADFLAHVSDSFEYKGRKKADLGGGNWWNEVRARQVTATVSGFDRDKVQYLDLNGTPAVEIVFNGLASVPDGKRMPLYFVARFVRDPDGRYRLRTFTPFNYIDRRQEEQIPQL